MKKRVVSILLASVMAVTVLAGCGSDGADDNTEAGTAAEDSSDDAEDGDAAADDTAASEYAGTEITFLNTKSEIQEQMEELADIYEDLTGVAIEVHVATGDSPSEEIAKKYAEGNAPTLIMADPQDVVEIAEEKAIALDGAEWASIGGEQYGIVIDDTLYSFPFCVEARGLMYNKTAIEETLGEDFDPADIKDLSDLETLLADLADAGMETPVALNKEDWSLAGHYLTQVYEEQDGTEEGAVAFVNALADDSEELINNDRFNALMDTFDVLKGYNMNIADPLAADYDLNAVALAEGDVAFWFNGNWAWGNMEEYVEDGIEYGIMPVVQNSTEGNANVNDYLCGGSSKQVMIDGVNSTVDQQEAAKEFLEWLVYNETAQSFLINDANLVPAFSNATLEVADPLGVSVQEYAAAGKVFESLTELPGDHWKEMGASMQKYLADETDREGLAAEITEYWKAQ